MNDFSEENISLVDDKHFKIVESSIKRRQKEKEIAKN